MNNEKKYANFEDVVKETLNKGHKFTAAKFEAEKHQIAVPSYDEQKRIAEAYATSVGKIINSDNKLDDKKTVSENAPNSKQSNANTKKTENELLKSYEEMLAEIDATANAKKAKIQARIDSVNKRIQTKKDKHLDRNAYLGEMFYEVYSQQLGETHEAMKNFVLSLCKDEETKARVDAIMFCDRKPPKGKKKTADKNA